MKLDRNHQLKILEYLRDYYHCPADARVNEQSFFHNEDYLMNLKYLYEYGLIKGYESKVIGKREFSLGGVEITAKGLDLLEDDGGVGAILRSVVVKFEAIEKEGHVEFKEILLTGKDQWHYQALILKRNRNGTETFYSLAHKNHRLVAFVYLPDKGKNPAYGGGNQSYV